MSQTASKKYTIRRYTDKTYTLRLTGFDFTVVEGIHVTFAQNNTAIFDMPDPTVMTNEVIQFHVTQEQSGLLQTDRPAELYVNWIANGERDARGPLVLTVLPNQPEEELHE